ncbi:hypothetical protein F4553_000921 [Allocatelliglobosispora scoriae]|uniref:Uncharacterized protein n=1 Tax=Allocatelliglobosispora scoriae TaxID=643052 RepID=A0A841BLB8_9ACTN|nr:hypothetical protein [Allocatelliglobosispora scoriae]MBB5867542.1 hypothetical protein [Allocatelliglobosispora scoriae]
MIFGSSRKLAKYCDQLEEADGAVAFEEAAQGLWSTAQKASPRDLTPALERCAWLLTSQSVGAGGRFSILCGSLVDLGAEPGSLVVPVADGLLRALDQAVRFRVSWPLASSDPKLPDPEEADEHLRDAVVKLTPVLGGEAAYRAAEGWFSVTNWARPAVTLLQRSPQLWADYPRRAELAAAIAKLVPDIPDLGGVHELLGGEQRPAVVGRHRAA